MAVGSTKLTERLLPVVLAFLRVVVGVDFLVRGLPKIMNTATVANYATGVHLPGFMGWFPTILEPVGGALLILGLGTRFISMYFMAEMIVTGIVSKVVIRGVPFVMPGGRPGYGFDLDSLLFACAFILVLLGPGLVAADGALAHVWRRGPAHSVSPAASQPAPLA